MDGGRSTQYQQDFYPESAFGGFTDVDGTICFYQRVNALLQQGSVVVDVGCGRGAYADDPLPYRRQLRILRGKCRKVIGLDVNPGARNNPFIDEFGLIEDDRWPLENNSTSLCIVDNVLEHVADPALFFKECWRVLEPGGYVCIRTPNLLSYIGLISWLIPNRQHTAVLSKVKDRVIPQDVFPTLYRCNTLWSLRRMLRQRGFEGCVYGHDAEPAYLSFSRFFYFLGVLHQRYAPNCLRISLHAFGRKIPRIEAS
jgi:SAM-dependent methyltransferase